MTSPELDEHSHFLVLPALGVAPADAAQVKGQNKSTMEPNATGNIHATSGGSIGSKQHTSRLSEQPNHTAYQQSENEAEQDAPINARIEILHHNVIHSRGRAWRDNSD